MLKGIFACPKSGAKKAPQTPTEGMDFLHEQRWQLSTPTVRTVCGHQPHETLLFFYCKIFCNIILLTCRVAFYEILKMDGLLCFYEGLVYRFLLGFYVNNINCFSCHANIGFVGGFILYFNL